MFTFSQLGRMGRFGNQLFQIASTVGIALKHEHEYVFPEWGQAGYFQRPIPQTSRLLIPELTFAQGAFHVVNFKLAVDPKHLVDLEGYFQSEKYFSHCEELVRSYFEPNASILREIEETHGERLRNGPTCIVVVRRGDNLLSPLYRSVMPAQFYHRAMEMFSDDTMFFVTSDDIEWCRANIKGERITYLPQEKWAHNFFLGTLCQDAIISNTTFGWWIAWLNKNQDKRVIAPKQWFGPAYSYHNTCDLLPNGWDTIDCISHESH
jgi:Glycosyl transferase family 11